MAHKNVGTIPTPGTLTDSDATLLAASAGAFTTVGNLLERCRFKAAISESMRVVSLANKYLSEQEPWKLKDDTARRDTVLNTALQVVSDANTMLTPFLPHASQKIHEALGGTGVWAAQPDLVEVDEEGGPSYPVLTGDYTAQQAHWGSTPLPVGRPLVKPSPLFTKLDDTLGETGPSWAPIG
jgi:methionyl-tRNA synthetase